MSEHADSSDLLFDAPRADETIVEVSAVEPEPHRPAFEPPAADAEEIGAGRVYVNDVPLHDDYVPVEFRSHDDWGPQIIQQGYYFVMGDHRNNSSDSRHWGPVPKKYIVGKVKVRWWPLQDARIF